MRIMSTILLFVMLSSSVFAVAPVNDYVLAQMSQDDKVDFWVEVIDAACGFFFGAWGFEQGSKYGNWCGVIFTIGGVASTLKAINILMDR